MSRAAGERWRCECGAELIGALTRTGKVAPIRIAPTPDGNVLLQRRKRDDLVHAITLAGLALDELRNAGAELRLNHFADCPNREQFERTPPTQEDQCSSRP